MIKIIYLTKLQVWTQFLASIIVDVIVIIFYKAIYNARLGFNLAITEFFDFFHIGILVFLFIMIHCSINKYQSGNKVFRPFDRKIV